MRDKIFGVLQKIGRSFMLPIAILPIAGLFLGIGGSFTNSTMLASYGLTSVMGEGTMAYNFLSILNASGSVVFSNLSLLFAVAVAIGMSDREKATGAIAAVLGFLIMNAVISQLIAITGTYDPSTLAVANDARQLEAVQNGTTYTPLLEENVRMLPSGAITTLLGFTTLATGVFGGIIMGLIAAHCNNKFHDQQLPAVLSFFAGTRFVPIMTALESILAGFILFWLWPYVQIGMNALGNLVISSGYIGTFVYGYIERALIPFGLHHVFYLPFWQTQVGGEMMIQGKMIYGAQNIFFAQLADPSCTEFNVEATRFMAGKFPFMIFGLPGAALAMYQTAYPEKKEVAGGLLLSAAITAMLTGITEPIEFTFIFVAPGLYYGVHCVLAGLSFMLMHIFNVGVGMTFSGGLIDLTLFGIMQGNDKTHWIWVVVVGVVYFFIYWILFKWIIVKWDLQTPGREREGQETKLYTKADYKAKKAGEAGEVDMRSAAITKGLGGKHNIDGDVDCCITRLRLNVIDPEKVDEALLKQTGAVGVVSKGKGLQVIYGPTVPNIKNALELFLETPESEKVDELLAGGNIQANEEVKEAAAAAVGTEYFQTPIEGRCAGIEETPDDAFSQKMLGDGIVIFPTGNKVYAPCDGSIEVLFPTNHAIGMKSAEGTELLIHIGVDTVNLEGKGFTPKIKQGDTVKQGDLLLELDLPFLEANAPSTAVPMIFTALPDSKKVVILKKGDVKPDEDIVEVTDK